MGRVVAFYASDRVYRALMDLASGASMSSTIRRILEDLLFGARFTIAVSAEHRWIVGKFLIEEFPVLLKKYNERITGELEDISVRVYG